jgi:hypothetical protein
MGACRHCGKSAGLFSSEHAKCKEKHEQAPGLLTRWAEETLSGRMPLETFKSRLQALQRDYHLRPEETRPAIAAAIQQAGERFLEDGLLSEEEEQLLSDMQRAGGITMQQIDAKELAQITLRYEFSRWQYAALLRDTLFAPKESLEERRKLGKMMANMTEIGPAFPFRLAPDEFLGNMEDDVLYYRTKTTRQFVGTSQGVSVRLGPGVYFRVGAFKGQPVEESQLERVDMGTLAYSNSALYFYGKKERFRIPFDGILSQEPGADTITIWRDRANAKPEVFRGDAGFGWYMANVIANIQLMDRPDGPSSGPPTSLKLVGK